MTENYNFDITYHVFTLLCAAIGMFYHLFNPVRSQHKIIISNNGIECCGTGQAKMNRIER